LNNYISKEILMIRKMPKSKDKSNMDIRTFTSATKNTKIKEGNKHYIKLVSKKEKTNEIEMSSTDNINVIELSKGKRKAIDAYILL